VIVDHNSTRYEQNVFHMDTDNPDHIDIKLTHTGLSGQLRFQDETLIEDGALDQIVFNIEFEDGDFYLDDINDVPFEDSFRQYVIYFPVSFINEGGKRRNDRTEWIRPKVLDQDAWPLIFKPPTMRVEISTLLDADSA